MRAIRRRPHTAAAAGLEGLPPLLARVYAARGVASRAELALDLADLLPPQPMLGIAAAGARLADAVTGGETILIAGDYDADGATSAALGVLALRALGAADVDFAVPNRFTFGYGLTPGFVDSIAARKPHLVVTVDNGIASIEGVERARELGIDVIVTDHHLPGAQLPAAVAIVDPNLPGCGFGSRNLAGVGVIFYVMGALRSCLRERGWFAGREAPNLAQLLDLVALGTVADVVPLDANNRILVRHGLRRLRAGGGRPGIRALLDLAGRDPARAVSTDLAFVVGPRINAAGRLDDMALGIRCLLEPDEGTARAMAARLDALNRERREIEAGMRADAERVFAQLEQQGERGLPWGLCIVREDWHQGVVGLVAGRLKERYHRPAFAFAPAGEGELKGSGRSIAGLHLRDALANIAARHPGLIPRFGGHAMAAGLSLAPSDFDAFAAAFDAEVRRVLDPADLDNVLETDGELDGADCTLANAELLRDAGPWGQHFPEPLFDGEFELLEQRIVGERHLRLRLRLPGGGTAEAIAFNIDTARWPAPGLRRARIAYRLDVNEWRGERRLQLLVEDIAPAGEPA